MPGDARDPADLEFATDEMRAMTEAVLARVLQHLATIAEQPASGDTEATEVCRAMREPAPAYGTALEPLLDRLFNDWIPRSFNSAGPGYLAYIPGGGVFPAALADFIAASTNRYTGVWRAAPALVQLEANVLEWFRDWMGFPPTTRGAFTTGGSMANFNAILCARERHLGVDLRRGVLYTSSQAHHSVHKAAKLAGIMPDRVRSLPVDSRFRLRRDALEDAIARDRRRGLVPFLVVSTAGTTTTGAIDPLDAIADVAAREGLWHHVDGAYGAFFYLCDELRPALAGLSRADSLALDPHKALFLPYGTGALLVRDGEALRAVHAATGTYLPPTDPEFYDPSQYGPDLTRGFPGLRVWLTIKLYGTERLKAALAEKRALAVEAAAALAALPGTVLVAPPELTLFAWHLTWPGATQEEENRATRALIEGVRARNRVLLSGCTVDGQFLARACLLCFRTRRARVEQFLEDVAAETSAILAARQ